jgi:hypothetical protein
MNYAQLTSAIQSFTENTFPLTETYTGDPVTSQQQIDTFIKQAEQRIYNTVQFAALRRNVTGQLLGGRRYLTCPDDFLSAFSLAVLLPSGDYEYLLDKDVNYIRQAYPSVGSQGVPRFYALYGPSYAGSKELSFIVGPTPNQNYAVELHYYFYPESITTANTTWLGDNFDSVLLYGALVEAAVFMKAEADQLATYEKQIKEALQLAKQLGDGKQRQDAYRSGQVRQPVS